MNSVYTEACPICGTLLEYECQTSELLCECPNCGYNEDFQDDDHKELCFDD